MEILGMTTLNVDASNTSEAQLSAITIITLILFALFIISSVANIVFLLMWFHGAYTNLSELKETAPNKNSTLVTIENLVPLWNLIGPFLNLLEMNKANKGSGVKENRTLIFSFWAGTLVSLVFGIWATYYQMMNAAERSTTIINTLEINIVVGLIISVVTTILGVIVFRNITKGQDSSYEGVISSTSAVVAASISNPDPLAGLDRENVNI
jgi:Domain of unknown function (DUF4328)